eukprot:gnl/MRDRNA2_/MRDRNA2_473688_c0_seq1.p1 gnl/MRDRNA2_/MRDRNA2_473688_c0~~gnl/MRDRNA2_/MRDRNA2_473688_c0_seq1.p1  ORF type:complete len:177 (+),score=11.19 gnl/MRDRNA2_/MRDRNA2_473688_c0_seq1:29-532(+)
MGVLQGGVYGHGNIHFATKLNLGSEPPVLSLRGMFRGAGFAGCRDCVSQGVPFAFSRTMERVVYDPIWPSGFGTRSTESGATNPVKRACAVMTTSIIATCMSQGLHNCQIRMQADQTITYPGVVQDLFKEHGLRFLYKGCSARVMLLLILNGLNEVFLRPAWEEVPI